MGIYIPGIETPKGHNYVTITIWPSGTASYGLFDRESNLCNFKNIKAVPVPPHGRTIDADILAAKCDDPYWCVWLSDINDAPTIIPAEPAEEGE